MRCKNGVSLLDKLERLMKAAGIETIDFSNRFAAIKNGRTSLIEQIFQSEKSGAARRARLFD